MRRVCVFCGSSEGNDPKFREAAVALGKALVARSLGLVYGGGRVGLMGVVADTVLAGGQEVIGVIPRQLAGAERAHDGVTELRVVETMHERKFMMAELADAFVTLPGGLGTLEECCEMLTWAQLTIHEKPCALLNIKGYYDPLLAFLDRGVEQGFIKPENRRLLQVETDPVALIEGLGEPKRARVEPWT